MPGHINERALVRTWVHAFEEDTPGQRVFRPDTHDLPPSRRPRVRYEFRPGGTAVKYTPGPADKSVPVQGTWKSDATGRVTLDLPGCAPEVLDIDSLEKDRLVVSA